MVYSRPLFRIFGVCLCGASRYGHLKQQPRFIFLSPEPQTPNPGTYRSGYCVIVYVIELIELCKLFQNRFFGVILRFHQDMGGKGMLGRVLGAQGSQS